MIPLAVPRLDGNEAKYLQECIETTFVSSVGPFADRFETEVAHAAGAEGAVATSSGTTGLHIALLAAGVEPDDLVILPAFTFIASANAISYCNATPWLFDLDPASLTLDPALVREGLRAETKQVAGRVIHTKTGRRVGCIMPVYTLGCPADMDEFNAIAEEYGLPLVADAAAAIGSRYKGRNIGDLADLTVFSFNGNKTITAGGGGAVLARSCEKREYLKHISTTARVGRQYLHDMVGFNYRMTNVNAAIACAQLERLDEFVAAKRRIKTRYDEAFTDLSGVDPIPTPDWAKSACWFSGVVLEGHDEAGVARILEQLNEEGIQARPFWMPIHFQPPYKNCPIHSCELSERIWSRILVLPCSTNLLPKEQEQVIDIVSGVIEST